MGWKWDIEKFTEDNDFGLWKVKMEAILIQKKCEKALKGEGVLPVTMSQAKKTQMVDKARSAINCRNCRLTTSQSLSALTVTRWVTSRRIV